MKETGFPRVVDAGDCALMVFFGDSLDMAVNRAVMAFDAALSAADWPEVEEITPAIRGLMLRYDPLAANASDLRERIESLLDERDWLRSGPVAGRRRWRLPVHYGEESGPDLEHVARQLGRDTGEVVREHSESRLHVLMLGFAPGCAYLGALPERWDLPRLDHVKPEVPPGSLSVAVRQTVLFATPIPTGWCTIGRTPFLSFSRHAEPYFNLAPGDEVGFEVIDRKRFDELAEAVAAGESIVAPETLE